MMADGDWLLPTDATAQEEDEYLSRKCAARGGKLVSAIEHSAAADDQCRKGATFVLDCTTGSRRRIKELAMSCVYDVLPLRRAHWYVAYNTTASCPRAGCTSFDKGAGATCENRGR